MDFLLFVLGVEGAGLLVGLLYGAAWVLVERRLAGH